MAYDEGLAQRIRESLARRGDIREKKMFGGLAFMLSGNMCCGVVRDTLMLRVGPGQYADALQQPHAREMDFTGRAMKGMVYVDAPGFAEDAALEDWLARAVSFASTLPPK